MSRLHIFDPHLAVAHRWMKELSANLDLAPEDHPCALHALRAGLHAIRDRLLARPDGHALLPAATMPRGRLTQRTGYSR